MPEWEKKILALIAKPSYEPVKPKVLARRLGITDAQYAEFRQVLRTLIRQKRVLMGKNHTIRGTSGHGSVTGIYRRTNSGHGYVRPHLIEGRASPEIYIREGDALDAATGDEVLVRVTRKPKRPDLLPGGVVLQVLERARRQFVGTYFERDGLGLVRVDGGVFVHSVYVGDPGAKGAQPNDKVVFEMLRFPTPDDRGEGVITEILGPRGQPGVDTLSVLRGFEIPDNFPEEVLEEARQAATLYREENLHGRDDLTEWTIVTIDPADAHDFDDAISLRVDPRSHHWQLGVHIADVAHFVPAGSMLDSEARKRGTSVYLPQRVVPMLPELISNGLASLQEGKVRYVKSVLMDFTPQGVRTESRFVNAAIRVKKRFSYEQVSAILADESAAAGLDEEVKQLLLRMRELAMILRKRRRKHGSLELSMPETELEYDDQGRVTGAHLAKHDVSHQVIEEFMLSANEAVAEHLDQLGVPFLRRIHPAPEPIKLEAFAAFARSLGYKITQATDRFSLQRILEESAPKPDVHAVHYSLLRSLKQAVYSPVEEEHYALASIHYCHFTSPIRRYPDLTVHRQLGRWIETGKTSGNATELAALGEHCTRTERRAESAERELIKVKLLTFLSDQIGRELGAIITGVADYGFFAQAEEFPVEGMVHVSTLSEDYYYHDEATHSLIGRRTQRRYRLGDRVRVTVVRVDLQRRQLDFRVVLPPAKRGKP